MNVIILDGYSINPGDISWKPIKDIAKFKCYDRSTPKEVLERIKNVDGIFVSKCTIDKTAINSAKNLKFIGVTATGYDNVDIEYAKKNDIAVFNVPAYSTEAVAQHTFALIMEITNHVGSYSNDIKQGRWYSSQDFLFYKDPLTLLHGKSLGIIGYGNIGKRVSNIAKAFGMKINIYSSNKESAIKSDILTLHCPATKENIGFVNEKFISNMKDGAILINTARGSLLNNLDVSQALKNGKLSAVGLDVLDTEPPETNHPLVETNNCFITPHIAWSPKEMRLLVIDTCAKNLKYFLTGRDTNRIV
ncbi:MAG TPA: D-2-hydroxyacid dehydrogenase [Anaerovoracaceae bacterium]|nr:D-2-hydroxyacid dehydrogenase [Anaerovoracaceae bacterium]